MQPWRKAVWRFIKKLRIRVPCVLCAVFSVTQSCPALCNPVDCSPPGSYVLGIFQAKILEWVPISYSMRLSWHRDPTHISSISHIGRFFTTTPPYNSAIPLLGIYLKKTKAVIRKDVCISTFIAAFFKIAESWKHPKCSSVNEWIKEMWDRYLYVMEY